MTTATGQDNLCIRFKVTSSFDQHILPLLRFQPAWIKDVIALLTGREQFSAGRRMIEGLTVDIIEAQHASCYVPRVRIHLQRARNERFVSMLDEHSRARAVSIAGEVVVISPRHVVRRSVLVNYPENFSRMLNEIGWKLHADDHIDRLTVGLGHVEHSPGQ